VGFENRDYNRAGQGGFQGSYGGGGGFNVGGLGLSAPVGMVKKLLIINVAVFVLQAITGGNQTSPIDQWFAARPDRLIEIWRLITFQFLHGDMWHIIMNMLGIYFLGPVLERHWGSKRFLQFYLLCGVVGGTLYLIFGAMGILPSGKLVGASGGVLGLLAAAAVLFPQFKVIMFIFPVPIRFAAILLVVVYFFNVLHKGANAGGDICHLGGMLTGFLWVRYKGLFTAMNEKRQEGAWAKKQQSTQKEHFELDRILAKVKEKGIHSLSSKEKSSLSAATEIQRRVSE
jgi:membrane associated rhomboid family serine protease